MSPPENVVGGLKRRDGEPTFNEPWQAQALAMANALISSGAFSGSAWAKTLGVELRSAQAGGAQDDADAYYAAVLRALERLLAEKHVSSSELAHRKHEWEHAYMETPHGQPVVLKRGDGEL